MTFPRLFIPFLHTMIKNLGFFFVFYPTSIIFAYR
ncbi:unknown [Prevotella sp. CAG:474]|nr:unknown [Prevotella sp. CAG:474]